jgi:site-specific DNA-methyltransferase (adenine-specific)
MIEEQKPPLRKTPVVGSSFSGSLISEVYLMDCIEGMKHYPDKYFDLAIVDPPYGINIANNSFRQKQTKKDWDISIPDILYFTELFRVSKEQIIWGGNYFDLPKSQGFIIWDKKQPYDFSSAMCEFAWSSIQKPAKIYSKHVVTAEPNKIHPTQKPVTLYDFCFDFAKIQEGSKVLDTHLGSGSSRISANKNKLNFVGFEIDEEYYNKQNKRYADFTAQTRLW